MNKSKSSIKRGPRPYKRNGVILALREMQRATSQDLGVETAFMDSLRRAGIVAVVDYAEKVGRGKKNNIYSLTKAGNGKASSLKRKVTPV